MIIKQFRYRIVDWTIGAGIYIKRIIVMNAMQSPKKHNVFMPTRVAKFHAKSP